MKTILIVEDDTSIKFALKMLFQSAGYKTLTASEKATAMRLVKEHEPDLITLDIMLIDGRNSGFELCREIKQDRNLKDIPIIILTVKGAEKDRELADEVKADAYITKPFNSGELMELVKKLITEK